MSIDAQRWEIEIAPKIQAIRDQKAQLLGAQREIFSRESRNLFAADLLYAAACNRSLKNAGGFLHCITDYRYCVSTLILRGQLDTLCRVYGLHIAADQQSYIKAFLAGKIRSEVDRQGSKLTDHVLVQHLERVRPGAATMYTALAGFAHLSVTHFLATFSAPDEDGQFSGLTHEQDEEIPIEEYAGVCTSFHDVTQTLLSAFSAYAQEGKMK